MIDAILLGRFAGADNPPCLPEIVEDARGDLGLLHVPLGLAIGPKGVNSLQSEQEQKEGQEFFHENGFDYQSRKERNFQGLFAQILQNHAPYPFGKRLHICHRQSGSLDGFTPNYAHGTRPQVKTRTGVGDVFHPDQCLDGDGFL